MDICNIVIVFIVGLLQYSVYTTEICYSELFTATCPDNSVIVITSAKYGRMKIGRCISSDFGYIGCGLDVQVKFDSLCSGRQQCMVTSSTVADMESVCIKELRQYLDITYECVQVEAPVALETCEGFANVSSYPNGYLSPQISTTRGFGGADCPWKITAAPGQSIEVYLLDFTPVIGYDDSQLCHVYATIREESGHSTATICTGFERRMHVYSSSPSSSLQIRLLETASEYNYLLEYKVVGCANPPVPSNMWIDRTNSSDKAIIGCTNSDAKWYLVCSDDQWVGSIGECQDNCSPVSVQIALPDQAGIEDTELALDFIESIVNSMRDAGNEMEVHIVPRFTTPDDAITLNTNNSEIELKLLVDSRRLRSTNIHQQLTYMTRYISQQTDAKKFAILIMDNQAECFGKSIKEVVALKTKMPLIVVGIRSHVVETEVEEFASPRMALVVDGYQKLADMVENVGKILC